MAVRHVPLRRARSWRHGSPLAETVLYFAFGANMSREVLAGRRGLRPLDARPAILPGHRLVFDLPGIPMVEPAFASIVPDETGQVHGVAWTLTTEDMRRLDSFESGRYARRPHTVEVRGRSTEAQAYVNRRPGRALRPSRRYLLLLARGAEEHGLPAEHVAWLRAHPAGDLPLLRPVGQGLIKLIHLLRGGS